MEYEYKPEATVERFLTLKGWHLGQGGWWHTDDIENVYTDEQALEEEAKRDGVNGTIAAILLMLKD